MLKVATRILAVVPRFLREQVDWAEVAELAAGNPFAEALLLLVDRRGIATVPSRT